MAFRVSPGVTVTEKDFTNIVPAVSTTRAGYAGQFNWGPIEQRVLVTSENELVNLFNKPDADNYKGWLAAANFLGYGGSLTVVRCTNSTAINSGFGNSGGALVKNQTIYEAGQDSNTGLYSAGLLGNYFIAKYAGSMGDSLRVAIVDFGATGTSQGTRGPDITTGTAAAVGATALHFAAGTAGNTSGGATNAIVGDVLKIGGINKTFTVTGVCGATSGSTIDFSPALTSALTVGSTAHWEFAYKSYVERTSTSTNLDFVGGTGDQFSVLVIDEDGKFGGVTNGVLEVYNNVSKAIDAKDGDGNSNYYVTKINNSSRYVVIGGEIIDTVGGNSAAGITFGDSGKTFNFAKRAYFSGASGAYASSSTNTNKLNAYNLLSDPDTVDVSLLIAGDADSSLSGEIIDIADARKDCVAFVSPEEADVVSETVTATQVSNVVEYHDNQLNKNSSYAFLDSGWKYQYDRYSDKLRWVPLNGDMAGLCARTDNVNDPWFSPAGFNRGQIRGAVKLALNPTDEAHRDELYKNNINPVVSFPGEGTILFGDKTLQSKGSAFDRINVRRLFIVLEKAISTASKFQLFEQNDSFTRAQFKNMIEPFLRDIQGRRGITDFKVVCDDTNNTSTVIDANKFVADIFVKPTRSINFIQLNFVATRSGVDFSEVAGG